MVELVRLVITKINNRGKTEQSPKKKNKDGGKRETNKKESQKDQYETKHTDCANNNKSKIK